MKIAYIAHPISGDLFENLEKVRLIVRKINLEEPRVIPFAPYFADCLALADSVPDERARGFKNNFHYFRAGIVNELRVYGDRITPGMQAVIDMAHKCGIPVVNYVQKLKLESPELEKLNFVPLEGWLVS